MQIRAVVNRYTTNGESIYSFFGFDGGSCVAKASIGFKGSNA